MGVRVLLTAIMKILARKESLSITQLAHEVGYSVKEVEGALEQLEHMGYIQRDQFEQSCSVGSGSKGCSSHCEGCSFAPSGSFVSWSLTERGQSYLEPTRK